MSLRLIAVTGLVMIGAACASGGGKSARRAACVLPSRDSVFTATGPAYLDCGVDRLAHLLTPAVRYDFTPPMTSGPSSACYAVDLEFVVDSTGRPETQTARAIRTSDQRYAESVLATLNMWKYEPALRDGIAVRQIVTERKRMATTTVIVKAGSPMPPMGAPAC